MEASSSKYLPFLYNEKNNSNDDDNDDDDDDDNFI